MNWLAVIDELTNNAHLDGRDRGTAFDALMLTADLRAQVPDPLWEQQPQVSERARELLVAGTAPEWRGDPLPREALTAQRMVEASLLADVEEQGVSGDRLYALEFQGPSRQYVKFGHTTGLKGRIDKHVRAANPHGWALLNGWVSQPLLPDATLAEQVLLRMGEAIQGHMHHRERFYDMPYERALYLIRCMSDHYSDPALVASLLARRESSVAGQRSGRRTVPAAGV